MKKLKSCKSLKVRKSKLLTGNECSNFEKLFAKKFNLNHCIAVANGTVALEAALRCLNLKKYDEVLVPSKSYQSQQVLLFPGGKPVFCDIDFNSQNIEINDLKKISDKTKVIVCVHLGGWPCDMKILLKLQSKIIFL